MGGQPKMIYSPYTGELLDPSAGSEAGGYRMAFGGWAWLYNPWTGKERDNRDVKTDPTGLAIWERDWGADGICGRFSTAGSYYGPRT